MNRRRRKGTYGLFRLTVIALLALGNVAISIVIIMLLANLLPYVEIIFSIVALAVILRMTVRLRAPDRTLAWAIVMMLVPVLGVVLYFSWGKVNFSKNEKGYLERSNHIMRDFLREENGDEIKTAEPELARQVAVLNRAGFPLYNGGEIDYFPSGELLFDRMLIDLCAAESYIFLNYYIIDDGELWQNIRAILIDKAAKGVDVRIIYDDFGCLKTIDPDFAKELREKNIKIKVFNPLHRYLRQLYALYRSHHKICVVDGKIAYTGGANIADEYINKLRRLGHWKDTGIRLTGGSARSITAIFLQMWDLLNANVETDFGHYMPQCNSSGDGYYLPFADGPANFPMNPAHDLYVTMCDTAKESIWYTTPYLTPDCVLRESLTIAARGGVDVRIVTPGKPDYIYVYAATRGHYQQLLDAGVKIYEYTPGFMHAKMAICDGKSAVVGTINMDSRSFFHQYENAVWFTGNSAVDDVKKDFEAIFAQSREIDAKEWAKRKFSQRIVEAALCLMTPLF